MIDTVAPTLVDFRVLFGSTSYSLIGSTRNDLPWQITGIEAVFSKPIANADANSFSGVVATGFSGLGTNTLTWTFSPISSGRWATALAGSGVDALTDAAGNPLGSGNGYSESFNVLYGDVTDDGYVTSADMLAVYQMVEAGGNSIFDDLNGDGQVDMSDVQIVRSLNGGSLPLSQQPQASAVPATGNSLLVGGVYPQTDTTALSDGTQINSITFLAHAGATAVEGNAVTLSGDIVNTSLGVQKLDLSVVLTGGAHSLNAVAGNLTIAGPISESSPSTIVVTGPGSVTLSGANTYTGGTSVLSGTLIITSASGLEVGSSLVVGANAGSGVGLSPASSDAGVSPAGQPAGTSTAQLAADASPASPSPAAASHPLAASPGQLPGPAIPAPLADRAILANFGGQAVNGMGAQRFAGGMASLAAGTGRSWWNDQGQNEERATVALDAVMEEYGT